jgi:hypothetical protein
VTELGEIIKLDIDIKGKFRTVDALEIDKKLFVITKGALKIVRPLEEDHVDVEDPQSIIERLRALKNKPDIFTFWQRLPDIEPKFHYYMEMDNVAAMPIANYAYWWETQLSPKARNKVRKAEKSGIRVEKATFDDAFVRGIVDIFNETSIRQDKPFWHFGKDFDVVKREFSRFLFREELLGAYLNDELVGFVMLAYAGRYAYLGQILSKIRHRDKAPNNLLIAKVVELCAKKSIPHLVYAKWPVGSLADFKEQNGFQKFELPRYFVPLTTLGSIALKCNAHHGIEGLLPESTVGYLKELRNKWYRKKAQKVRLDT